MIIHFYISEFSKNLCGNKKCRGQPLPLMLRACTVKKEKRQMATEDFFKKL